MRKPLSTLAAMAAMSTMALAQAGLDPVYRSLEQQGYTVMETVREANQIRIRAERGDATRELVYDANTGKLLSDDALRLQTQDRDRDRLRDATGDGVPDQDQARDRIHAPAGGAMAGAGGAGPRNR
jgi:hypothetical protein